MEEPVEIFRWDAAQVLTEDAGAGIVDDDVDGLGVELCKGGLDEVFAKGGTFLIGGDGNGLDAEASNSFEGFGGSGSVFSVMNDDL